MSAEKLSPDLSRKNSSLGIRAQLIVGFALAIVVLMIAIIVTLFIVNSSKNAAKQVIETDLPTHESSLDLQGQIYVTQTALQGWLLTRDLKYKTEFERAWNNTNRLIVKMDGLSKEWGNSDNNRKWDEAKLLITQLKIAQTQALNEQSALPILTNEINPVFNKLLDIIDGPISTAGDRIGGMFDAEYHKLDQGSKQIITNMTLIQITEYILLITGIIVLLSITLYTSRRILRHVNIFRDFSSKVASGDLTQRVIIQTSDEIGQLGIDLNTMTESLAGITKQITQACHNMVATLDEVRHTVDVQSSGASEQASSINQITASLDEIEKSSAQTLDKAKSLGEAAVRTTERGQQGMESIEQSIHGMRTVRDKVQIIAQTILDLSNQTQQVGEITAVVNTLAQQSKMLALNASIEAAKAGEAGKGFAVVAAEVKNLAEQSEQSTAQVQKILEDIRHATEKAVMATEEGTKGVDHGTGLVEQTGEIFRNLSDVIHETTLASQQIEAAVRQESVGIEQITSGMNEINQVTASFVDSVKQTTEAIANLSEIAKNLKEHIDVYKL